MKRMDYYGSMKWKGVVNVKVVLQAIIGSIAIHAIYIVGYIKTRNYKPDIINAWDKVETLQNEVVIGKVISPSFFYSRL